MKNISLFLLLFFSVLSLTCTNPIMVEIGEEFKLKYGKQAIIPGEGLTISFLNTTEDSRCPIGVVCVWEGNAGVVLRYDKDSQADTDTINTLLDPKFSNFLDYKISLKNLDPYPVHGDTIIVTDYVATLLVERVSDRAD